MMLFIDAHVHVHDCFNLDQLLNHALDNFKWQAGPMAEKRSLEGVLCLTEARGALFFEKLLGVAGGRRSSAVRWLAAWSLEKTEEDCSLIARNAEGAAVLLVAGRQVVASERLEVLALGTPSRVEDGKPLQVTLEEVGGLGGIAVIPWGFGKWSGTRGRLLTRLLSGGTSNSSVFLGDNGGRPALLPRPFHFELAESNGIGILPGSDPLPFRSEVSRAGSFGFMVEQDLELQHPAEDLKMMLRQRKLQIHPYGELERVGRFFRNQARMQWVKLARKAKEIRS